MYDGGMVQADVRTKISMPGAVDGLNQISGIVGGLNQRYHGSPQFLKQFRPGLYASIMGRHRRATHRGSECRKAEQRGEPRQYESAKKHGTHTRLEADTLQASKSILTQGICGTDGGSVLKRG
jgi:hypothetical protein